MPHESYAINGGKSRLWTHTQSMYSKPPSSFAKAQTTLVCVRTTEDEQNIYLTCDLRTIRNSSLSPSAHAYTTQVKLMFTSMHTISITRDVHLDNDSPVFLVIWYHVTWELLTLLSDGRGNGSRKWRWWQIKVITQNLCKLFRCYHGLCCAIKRIDYEVMDDSKRHMYTAIKTKTVVVLEINRIFKGITYK